MTSPEKEIKKTNGTESAKDSNGVRSLPINKRHAMRVHTF